MADKSTFSPEEWQLLMESVMATGVAVSAAAPSGLLGMLKESIASARTLIEAKGEPHTNALIKALVADLETAEGRDNTRTALRKSLANAKKPEEFGARSIETLRRASALLDAKAPQDAEAVKAWLRRISQSVAEAAREGGFLGVGGVAVNEQERTALSSISNALG